MNSLEPSGMHKYVHEQHTNVMYVCISFYGNSIDHIHTMIIFIDKSYMSLVSEIDSEVNRRSYEVWGMRRSRGLELRCGVVTSH